MEWRGSEAELAMRIDWEPFSDGSAILHIYLDEYGVIHVHDENGWEVIPDLKPGDHGYEELLEFLEKNANY